MGDFLTELKNYPDSVTIAYDVKLFAAQLLFEFAAVFNSLTHAIERKSYIIVWFPQGFIGLPV